MKPPEVNICETKRKEVKVASSSHFSLMIENTCSRESWGWNKMAIGRPQTLLPSLSTSKVQLQKATISADHLRTIRTALLWWRLYRKTWDQVGGWRCNLFRILNHGMWPRRWRDCHRPKDLPKKRGGFSPILGIPTWGPVLGRFFGWFEDQQSSRSCRKLRLCSLWTCRQPCLVPSSREEEAG